MLDHVTTTALGPPPDAPHLANTVRWRRPSPALTGHLAGLVVALVILVCDARGAWFFFDEWSFLGSDRANFTIDTLLRPHNEHWSTLPLLVYHGLESAVGLSSYWPYLAVLFALHLTTTHLLWRLMVGMGSRPWIATGLCWTFGLLAVGYENLLWAFQIGFVGSVALGLSSVLVVTSRTAGVRMMIVVIVLLVASLASSGVGLVFMVVTPAVVALRSRREAVPVFLIPLIVYGLWHIAYGVPPEAPAHWDDPVQVLGLGVYVMSGLSWAVAGLVGLPIPDGAGLIGTTAFHGGWRLVAGLIALSWLAIFGYRAAKRGGLHVRQSVILALGAPVFFGMAALARIGFGVGEAESSRYAYVAVAFLLPAVGLLASACAQGSWRRNLAISVALGSIAGANAFELSDRAASWVQATTGYRLTMEASIQLAGSGAAIFEGADLEPSRAPGITMKDVSRWRRSGTWQPKKRRLTTTDAASAALSMQVAVRPAQNPTQQATCRAPDRHHPFTAPLRVGEVATLQVSGDQLLGITLLRPGGVRSRTQETVLRPGVYTINALLDSGTLMISSLGPGLKLSVC